MIEQPDATGRQRLSRSWRRGSILVGLGSAAGVALPYVVAAPSDTLRILALVGGLVGVVCLWLLADAFRPWITDDAGQEERDHAERSVLRAYRFLAALAVAFGAYLVLWDPPLDALGARQVRTLIWVCIGLVLLLPPLMSAWADRPEEEGWEEVTLAELLHGRFRGVSGRLHRAALVVLLAAVPLLVIGPRPPSGTRELWWLGALAVCVTGLVLGLWVLARTLLRDRGADGNG
ncbi:MAG TPA: hypothetical protein VF167_10365 [Longimicrobiaceae bacterium]